MSKYRIINISLKTLKVRDSIGIKHRELNRLHFLAEIKYATLNNELLGKATGFIGFNGTGAINDHIDIKIVIVTRIAANAGNYGNKATFITLSRNQLFLTIAASIKIIYINRSRNLQLSSDFGAIGHCGLELTTNNIVQHAIGTISLTRLCSGSYISEVNTYNISHIAIGSNIKSAINERGAGIFALRARNLRLQLVFIKVALQLNAIIHSILHDLFSFN